MMTIARQLRARPVQVLSVLFIINGLAVGAMMAQAADNGVAVPLLGATALLATLAALIGLARFVQEPLERLETAVRSLSAEVARGGDPVTGLGLRLASSGDLTASTRSLLRLRQVVSDRNRRSEQENLHRRNVDALLASEMLKQSSEEQVRHHAVAELADGLRRLANGEIGLQMELAMPPELEPVRIHFNRASLMLAENLGGDGSHAAVVRDTGIALAASSDLARQGSDQASGIIELRRSASMLGRGSGARAEEAQELAAFAAWARTEIRQCMQALAGAKTVIDTLAKTSGDVNATAHGVQDILREASLASLDLGIAAVHANEEGKDLGTVLAEVRGLAARAASAAASLSALTMPSGGRTAGAVAAVEKALADMELIGQQMEVLEDRATTLARAGQEDAVLMGEVELVVRELEDGARGHANTVEKTVLAMHALSRSLGRLELKMDLFRQPTVSASLTEQLPLPANTSRSTGPRPYLRRVK